MFRQAVCAAAFVATVASSSSTYAQSAPPALAQCATFNTLADHHADQAQNVQKAIEAQAATLPPEQAKAFIEDKSKAIKSEWELAGLARESYRKCLKDYLQAGAAPAAPQAAVPVQPAPVQQAPVQQVQPVQQAPVQQARPVQQQQQYVRRQQPQQQQEEVQRPSLLPLIGLGIGLGRGF